MISHQDVSAELKLIAGAVVVEQFQVTAPIGIGTEDHLALIATRDHMVKRTGKMNSWFSCHGSSVITTVIVNAKDK